MVSLAVSPLFSNGVQQQPPFLRDAGTMGEPFHLSPFLTESIGSGAAILTTVAFFPQVLRTWRKGGEDGLSWAMLLLYLAGLGLWFAYGVLLTSMPLMLANGITGMLVLLILGLKAWRATQRARLRATGLAEDSPQ
jgi:MtN3 and saliva related transmembrane protein